MIEYGIRDRYVLIGDEPVGTRRDVAEVKARQASMYHGAWSGDRFEVVQREVTHWRSSPTDEELLRKVCP
ncbi:hypothetical protein BH790_gp69 [Gordonia phage Gsput1]|uniref:Uncharacterized protein n=1 Tax=Gordonia phage Gsput1 TaxID=1622193 RepID=A0A0E3T710_9CAUD|nr:hypothetical protein BH790_gp69 [Gordonia phage Gsput1]AKC03094.1 hypothetical protein Gsput1_69 [Gordonia phage Gsput1]